MTQSSVAVSVDGAAWVLLNASPDIGAQLLATRALHPRELRHTPIAAVVVTNADVDHIAGLLTLREKTGFTLFATADVLGTLDGNRVFDVLDRGLIPRRAITPGRGFEPVPGLTVTAFAVPGKVALYLEGDDPALQALGEQTVGLMLETADRRVAYIPGCAAVPDWLVERLEGVDVLMFDGTVWSDDDMMRTGTGRKTGARMGHVPMDGPNGSLARLSGLASRKIYVHINNTNPALRPDGPERRATEDAGWELARDGMEITI